jgi:hypothetical protein
VIVICNLAPRHILEESSSGILIGKRLVTKKFDHTKEVIRKKIEGGQSKNKKNPNNYLQNTTQKTKNRVTRTPWGELRSSGMVSSFCSTCDTRHATLVTNPMINH